MKQIILFGAGGHAAVIIDILKAQILAGSPFEIKGFLDDSNKKEWMGYPVLGTISSALSFHDEETFFIIAIGNNSVREAIQHQYGMLNFMTAIHPTAIIGSNVVIDDGTVVMPGAIINANSKIGRHVIINSGAIVEHDNVIGDYVHLSPNATLCGAVKVGKLTHIGANATVIQGINVGEQSVIGAGSTVIREIPSSVIAVGTPAKVVQK